MHQEFGSDLERLVQQCGAGDDAAWRRLLDGVRRLALEAGTRTYRLSREEAEDVAQVVQIRVTERLAQLREPAAFPLWARRMVHHAALDALRQRRPLVCLDDYTPAEADALLPPAADPFKNVLLRTDLSRALDRLPERYREPVQLQILQGLPQEEISRRLGRPRSTVATQVERGLMRLRRSLAGFSTAAA
jgi:RNA polymerase sigma-70 factor (ECF subfamily)